MSVIHKKNNDMKLDEFRNDLEKIETEIKAIVGPGKDDWVEVPETANREKLDELLESRRYCLEW